MAEDIEIKVFSSKVVDDYHYQIGETLSLHTGFICENFQRANLTKFIHVDLYFRETTESDLK